MNETRPQWMFNPIGRHYTLPPVNSEPVYDWCDICHTQHLKTWLNLHKRLAHGGDW